ncbi:ArnT family glycosyltransferase [Luteimonas salinilitoris]|uniref:ArnT family glycosyltransferase n=1 Tax=Luteimonas salinilitoris TaxID=3237697 RepID=A0ABV4HXT6_9GAMM
MTQRPVTRFSAAFALLPQSVQAAGLLLLAAFVGAAIRLPAAQLLGDPEAVAPSAPVRALLIALVLATLASAIYLARRRSPLPILPFFAFAAAAAILVKALLIVTVEPRWAGDFLRYWESTKAMVENGAVNAGTSIYKQRASVVLYPVYKIFGDAPIALKIVNAFGWLLTALLAYDMLRISRNHQAAQAFTVLFLLCPMPAFDALFPSHDLWGTLILTMALWSMTRASYSAPRRAMAWPRVIAYALVCGFSVVLLEIQRGAASMLPLAMLITAALLMLARSTSDRQTSDWQFRKPAPLVVAITALLLFAPLIFAAEQAGFMKSNTVDRVRAAPLMQMAAHGGVFGNARSATWVRFDERFTEKREQGSAAVVDFAQSIVLTSWADPEGSKLRLIRAVSPRLFQLGYPSDWDVSLRSPAGMSPETRSVLVGYTNAFGFILAVTITLSLLVAALSGRTPPLPVLLALVFTLLLATSLLGFFENKPPNLYSGWLAYLMLISWLASTVPSKPGIASKRGVITSVVGVALLCGTYMTARAALDAFYDAEDGRIITNWEVERRPVDGRQGPGHSPHPWPLAFNTEYYAKGSIKDWIREDAGGDSKRLAKYASNFFTIMEHPLPMERGDRIVMSKQVCTDSRRTSLEFFLFALYQRQDRPDSFVLEVSSDGEVHRRIGIPLKERNFRLITVDGIFSQPGCRMVELSLKSNVKSTRDSWRRASHVEIWNPRLIDSSATH